MSEIYRKARSHPCEYPDQGELQGKPRPGSPEGFEIYLLMSGVFPYG